MWSVEKRKLHQNRIHMRYTYDFALISGMFETFLKYFTLNIVTLSDDRWTKLQQSVISKVLRTYRKHS